MSTQQLAGYKAAHTRKLQRIDERVSIGELTKQQGAAQKAAATRRLKAQLAAPGQALPTKKKSTKAITRSYHPSNVRMVAKETGYSKQAIVEVANFAADRGILVKICGIPFGAFQAGNTDRTDTAGPGI